MTTFFRQDVTCAGCRKSSEHDALGSTNAFGSADLDLRPPEMKRSTMRAWLQRCPHCGYVAPNLSKAVADMTLVSSPAYRFTLNDARLPELARRFLAHALLVVSADPGEAAHVRLCAAWVCDDSRLTDLADECRRLCADGFEKLKPFADSEAGVTQGAVYVDVLRRAGQFDRAAAECVALLTCRSAAGSLRQVLEYQGRLIAAQDTSAHRIEESGGASA